MKLFTVFALLLVPFIMFGTDFNLSYDTNWPNRADELCSGTHSPDIYYKSISSPLNDTHLVGVDSEVLSNGNYIVLSQIYGDVDGNPTFSNPSRYYLSVIDEDDGDELDNLYSTLITFGYTEMFDIEKIPGETNSYLIVGKSKYVTLIPSTTSYRVAVAKITVNASNVISVAWSQSINSDTTEKAGYSVAINDGKVYIGGYSGLSGTVLKADLTSTGLTNITTLYSLSGVSCVINKVKFDEDMDNLLVAGGYTYIRSLQLIGSKSFLYEMNESDGSIVDSYIRSDDYSDHIRMTGFAYNYANNLLVFSEIEDGVNYLYDTEDPFGTPSTNSVVFDVTPNNGINDPIPRQTPLSIDTIYHNNDDAVFIDIDKNYTYLRADKNLDGDFSDAGDDIDFFVNAMWTCNSIVKGSAVENAHVKIIDNDETVSVGSVLEPDSDYFKLFIQKSYYN